MLRRVLKNKQADRLLWVTLFVLTLLGVAVAIWLSLNAEQRARWVGGGPPEVELEENPLAAKASHADSTPPVAAYRGDSMASATPAPAPEIVPRAVSLRQLTTPLQLRVAPVTAPCRTALSKRGPWLDSVTARPWPECVDAAGNPMVVQLCTYVQLTTGEWVLSENSRNVPRCRIELSLVRAGKVGPARSR
jgi:hypothetical protein